MSLGWGVEWMYVCWGCIEEGGVRMCFWVVRDEKEKLMVLVVEIFKEIERDGFSSRYCVRLFRGEW